MKTKATLTLNLTYEGSDATDKEIERVLDFLVSYAASNGLLSGDNLDLTVDEWSHTIKTETADDEVPGPHYPYPEFADD